MMTTSSSFGAHLTAILSFYDELLEAQEYRGLLIPSGIPKMRFLDDNPYPFKVNVHFKALLPVIDAPYSYIIYRPGNKPVLIYYQPKDYWHIVPSDPKGVWVDYFDIKIVTEKEAWQKYLPEHRKNLVWLGEPQRELKTLNIININPDAMLNPIHYRRAIKSNYEIGCLRAANLKAARGHLAAKEAFYAGCSEFEIHLAYLGAAEQLEEQLPYGNIVALNEHGAVLHYTALEHQRLKESNRHSFLLDAGADYQGYCSDITRTWAYQQGEFSDIIECFNQLQLELVGQLSANTSYVEMHLQTHLKIARLLNECNFIYCAAETALETGISSTFYPHGLGHLLGLQVHDIGGHQTSAAGEITAPPPAHPFLRLTKVLQAGFCVTVEPGLYFIDLLLNQLAASKHADLVNWTKVNAFKKYGGIRIEDDVIITDDGTENLTREAFLKCAND